MVRATAANAQIRAFACTTRETVETARASHNTSPVVTAALGRLLSAGAMMGSMLKGDDELITLQIKGDGPIGGLTVTADMNGHVKGYANVPDVILPANAQGKLDVGGAVGAGALSVIRDMGLKDPYVGQTELQTGEIAEDDCFSYYDQYNILFFLFRYLYHNHVVQMFFLQNNMKPFYLCLPDHSCGNV